MQEKPISVYLLISGILNLVGKLVIGAPSKSSQVMAPSKVLICLIFCLSLSIQTYGSSEVGVGTVIRG